MRRYWLLPIISALLLGGGCSSDADKGGAQNGTPHPAAEPPESTPPPPSGSTNASGTAMEGDPKPGEQVAVLETELGRIVIAFLEEKAPKHVTNFQALVKKGFYDGTKFHRIIPNFMIQGGDPNTKKNDRSSWGMGGSGTNIAAEFNDTPHLRGTVSMARSSAPDSASSQFFIVVADSPHLDGQYTAFGRVVAGMDVADKIVLRPADGEMAVEPVAIKKGRMAAWPLKD